MRQTQQLPDVVISVLDDMTKHRDRRLEVFKKLTAGGEQRKMWWAMANSRPLSQRWVYDFLNVVISSGPDQLAPYLRLTPTEAKKLAKRMQTLFQRLVGEYRKNGMLHQVIQWGGILCQHNQKTLYGNLHTVPVDKALEGYATIAKKMLTGHKLSARRQRADRGGQVVSIQGEIIFIRRVAQYARHFYPGIEHQITAAAVNGIYASSYTAPEVKKKLRTRHRL